MFRRLLMTIFRLYMKHLLSSYTKHTRAVYMGKTFNHRDHSNSDLKAGDFYYSRTPLIRKLVTRISNNPDLLGPSTKLFLL